MNQKYFIVFALALVTWVGWTNGDNSQYMFPYGPSEGDETLQRSDDESSSIEIRLKTPIVHYGEQYSSAYVNLNGLVSFLTDIPVFVNVEFPLDYPCIAPFYSDVDTRVTGDVFYRVSEDDDTLEQARTYFSDHFTTATNFQPRSVFIATWNRVGYFDRKSDKTNTFQVIVATDGGDSYALLIYNDVQWIQGTGKSPSMPDAKAQAGFISASGQYYELKGSGTDQVSTLHKRSNTGENGLWAFRIGRISRDQVEEPDLNTILDSSSESTSSCAVSGVTDCHSQAECIDFDPGFCCKCSRGFYGNGRICLQDDIPLRMNGKVKGVLNGIAINDSDLFSYILPQDGRAYTAIAKVPERLGYDLQSIVVLGTSIGWMFSTTIRGAPNGFMMTGGHFNYSADVNFYQTGQKVEIIQNFEGLDVFSHLKVNTRIHGSAPIVPVGTTIEVHNIKMEFTRVAPGLLRSSSSHFYTVEGTSEETHFRVEQTVEFEECPWASPLPIGMDTTTMKVGRNYIVYDVSQEIVRFAITSKVTPKEGDDPCKENKDKCGPNSSCVVEDDEFKCICDKGYEPQYQYRENEEIEAEFPVCVDINECQIGISTCDVTANCVNSEGGFTCICPPGFLGDGYVCEKILTCNDVQCGPNAECIEFSPGNPECKCLPGFYGDGLFCYERTGVDVQQPDPSNTGVNQPQPDCRHVKNLCDIFGECVYSPDSNSYVCQCRSGYQGDGLRCHRDAETETCDIENNCDPNADCKLDVQLNEYTCMCRHSYIGDGYVCTRSPDFEGLYPEQAPEPICALNKCICPQGYVYDDERAKCVLPGELSTPDEMSCQVDEGLCDPNASCLLQNGIYQCFCNTGYAGDGKDCVPQDFCSSHSECSPYGECTYDQHGLRYSCRCREGFQGDGKNCSPRDDVGCDILRNCDDNARCSWNTNMSKYTCVCNPGFLGDGTQCHEDAQSCVTNQNCADDAECRFDDQTKTHRCQCLPGYEGDGLICTKSIPCYQDSEICHENAQCLLNQGNGEWRCQCSSGYTGDGFECMKIATRNSNFLIVTKGMSLIKVPLDGAKPQPLVVEPFQTAIGIDIDCHNQKVYWSDVATRAIRFGSLNGTDRGTFIEDDIGSPEGLSVDWASQNIYWTDSSKDTIEVANLKSNIRKVLVSDNLVNPRGIVVYPQRGRLFWTDWNREYPKIEYSGLDGQGRQILVGEGLALPNSLIMDDSKEQLCWADAGTHRIECVNIDGRNRQTYISKIKYPFGLALGGGIFYWSDWETKMVEQGNKENGELGTGIQVSLGGLGKLYGIVFVPSTCPAVYSPCEYNPCGAERICLPNLRGSRSCICSEDAGPSCQNLL